jgi:MoaA/NifB/PqqE/SkfB family radical SAM enzyme
MKRKPKIVVWNVTSKCNMNCGFCFRPARIKEVSTEEALKKIDQFKKQEVTSLVFTGGEPLLRHDIVTLIKEAKRKNLFTILHTNGLLLRKEFVDGIENYLDQINLPLDGYNEETNSLMRMKGHFQRILDCLDLLKNRKIKVIISTVATKINKDFLVKISRIIPDFVYKWRIFQFSPQGKAAKVADKFSISEDDLEKLTRQIEKLKLSFKVQLVSDKDKKFRDSYYIV